MPSPDSDSKLIIQFMNNTQNTHRAIVTNSVGMAVLSLKMNYLKVASNTADLIAKYERAIEEIKFAAKDNVIRIAAVDFLINAAREPLNEYDSVHLFLPDKDHVFRKQKHDIPLTHVIPLVWLALKDHEKFAHDINYPALSAEQQFTRARGEYNRRQDNFFSLLIELRDNNLCHQGIRNEIVFLLNKIYADIEIIEDDLSTIAATLKFHTNNLFWEKYKNAATPALKKQLTSALFIWMGEYNSKPLRELIDLENTAHAILVALFIRHGSDPVEMNLKQLIDDCWPTLNFTDDVQQFPVIQCIENIFNSSAENVTLERASATMKTWLMTHANLEDAQQAENIRQFNTLYQIYQSFDARMQSLLEATGNLQENYLAWRTTCEDYFTVFADIDLSKEYPTPSPDLCTNAQQLKLHIDKFKADRMVDQIENFFARWNLVRKSGNAAKYLYRLFLEVDIFQKKALLSAAEIESFLTAQREATNVLYITVFEINRIFLHAIIIEPESWDAKFCLVLALTFDFVKNNLNNAGDSNINANLMKTSYPAELIKHLSYLKARYEVQQGLLAPEDLKLDSQSGSYLFLPEQIRRPLQWLLLANWVTEEKLLEIYQPQAVRINKLIRTWLINNITRAISTPAEWLKGAFLALPSNYRIMLFQDPETVMAIKVAFEYNRSALAELINRMVLVTDRIASWEALKPLLTLHLDFYKNQNGMDIVMMILAALPTQDRLRFLGIFSEVDQGNILLSPSYYDIWFSYLTNTDLLTYLKLFDLDTLFEKFKTNEKNCQTAFKAQLSMPQRIELLKHFSPKFTSQLFCEDYLEFIVFIKLSFIDVNSIKLLHYLSIVADTVDLMKLTTDYDYWQTTFKNIPAEKRLGFLLIFGNTQHLFRQQPYLTLIAENLTPTEFYFYAVARPNRPLLRPYLELNPKICISVFLAKLPESTRYEVLSYTYDGRIAAQSNVVAILKTLPFEHKWAFLKMAHKINADIFSHLVASDREEWNAIERTLPFTAREYNPNIYRDFIGTFTKIYMALRAGQTSLFKSDMQHQHNSVDIILDYAVMHPNSRTAKTLALMKKYSDYRHRNINLMTEIYLYGFSNSGMFKRAETPYGYLYTAKSVQQSILKGEPIFGMFGFKNSRRGKIFKEMKKATNWPDTWRPNIKL